MCLPAAGLAWPPPGRLSFGAWIPQWGCVYQQNNRCSSVLRGREDQGWWRALRLSAPALPPSPSRYGLTCPAGAGSRVSFPLLRRLAFSQSRCAGGSGPFILTNWMCRQSSRPAKSASEPAIKQLSRFVFQILFLLFFVAWETSFLVILILDRPIVSLWFKSQLYLNKSDLHLEKSFGFWRKIF